jgi:hypothetical protein
VTHAAAASGGEGRGEHPHGEPGTREVEAARGPEEPEQVEVGEADEGAVVAADTEREVGPDGEEGHHVGPRDAASRWSGVRAGDGGRVARHGLRAADRCERGKRQEVFGIRRRVVTYDSHTS